MRFRQDEQGQSLILVVFSMGLLLGFLALAIDVGILFRTKRNLQIAADNAATAAALDYYYNSTANGAVASAEAVGVAAAGQMGVTPSLVTMHYASEITTPYHRTAGYFETVITQPNATVFMSLFGYSNVNVTARAVAGTPSPAQGCVYVTNPANVCPAMHLQGSFTVNANCGVVVEGTCSSALDFTGRGGTLTASSVAVQGGVGGQSSDSTPAPVTGVAAITNPLQAIVPPTPSNCTAATTLSGTIGTAGGTVCYSGNITLSNATINGTVVFTGNLTLAGTVTTGSSGGTIDLNSGTMTESSGTTINLTAPTSGPYMGIALMAPPTNTSTITFEFGNTSGTLNGIIDTPGANLYLHDSGGDRNGGLTLTTDLVVGTLDDQTANLTVYSYGQTNPGSNPLLSVSLVE